MVSEIVGWDRSPKVVALMIGCWRRVLGFCLYPINPSRFSNQYRTGANRCTPTLPR